MNNKATIFKLTIFGSIIAIVLYQSYQYDNIFAPFFYIAFGIAESYVLFTTVFNDRKEYERSGKFGSFLPTSIGCFFVILILSIFIYFESKENAPSLLKADKYWLSADFKKNGNYIIKSGSWASRTHFYGKYSLKDSIITIDKKNLDDVLTTNRMVIRKLTDPYGEDKDGESLAETKNYLIQINEKGEEVKNRLIDFDKNHQPVFDMFMFKITEDNR